MGTYIHTGNKSFTDNTRSRYVDKTAMIAFINSTLNTTYRLTCVTRPRRFGKSIAANMLCAYYDQSCDSSALFAPFAIARDTSYREHLNRYPVIFIDVTKITTAHRGRKDIVKILQRSVKEEVLAAYPNITVPRNANLMDTLTTVASQTGQQFILIIDEWDALCRELADRPQLMDEYVDLLRRMFKTSDTAHVFAGVYMTGILPIKKYGTQSALNNFREYSMTTPGPMAGFIGFDDADVKALAEQYAMSLDELRHWYDGYKFDTFDWRQDVPTVTQTSIYNANSVMTAIANRACATYWSKSESFEALQEYIDMDFEGVRETIERLVLGQPITLRALRFGNDQNCINSSEELFTLLCHFGYLSYNPKTLEAILPNQEIREEFVEALRGSKRHAELSKLVNDPYLQL